MTSRDITYCTQDKCPVCNQCARHTAMLRLPYDAIVSMFAPEYDETGCGDFMEERE